MKLSSIVKKICYYQNSIIYLFDIENINYEKILYYLKLSEFETYVSDKYLLVYAENFQKADYIIEQISKSFQNVSIDRISYNRNGFIIRRLGTEKNLYVKYIESLYQNIDLNRLSNEHGWAFHGLIDRWNRYISIYKEDFLNEWQKNSVEGDFS